MIMLTSRNNGHGFVDSKFYTMELLAQSGNIGMASFSSCKHCLDDLLHMGGDFIR
jgi:hypothetical protein